jgi:hypothetical protein
LVSLAESELRLFVGCLVVTIGWSPTAARSASNPAVSSSSAADWASLLRLDW